MKTSIVFLILIFFTTSCNPPDYAWVQDEYDYMSEIGWKNENFKIETSWIQIDNPPYAYDVTTQYFKWYRHDSLLMEGYIKDFIEKYAKSKETYALVQLSNGYYTQFKKVVSDNYIGLDTKWPRMTKDSLALFEYERLNAY